MLSSWLKTEAN